LAMFQIGDLARELLHLLLQTGGFRRRVVMGHDQGADKSQDAEQSLDEALPGLDHGAFGGSFAVIGIQHEASGRRGGSFRVDTILTHLGRGL